MLGNINGKMAVTIKLPKDAIHDKELRQICQNPQTIILHFYPFMA